MVFYNAAGWTRPSLLCPPVNLTRFAPCPGGLRVPFGNLPCVFPPRLFFFPFFDLVSPVEGCLRLPHLVRVLVALLGWFFFFSPLFFGCFLAVVGSGDFFPDDPGPSHGSQPGHASCEFFLLLEFPLWFPPLTPLEGRDLSCSSYLGCPLR